jgi:hypothetical protein
LAFLAFLPLCLMRYDSRRILMTPAGSCRIAISRWHGWLEVNPDGYPELQFL